MEAPNQSQSVRSRMESLRLTCDGDISAHQRRMESLASSLRESMESVKARAQLAVQNQGRLSKLRDGLKETEDEFVKSLSGTSGQVKASQVKTCKAARRMKLEDAIAAAKSRLDELNTNLLEQNAAKDRFAVIISKELLDLSVREQANKQGSGKKVEIQEAIAWYNKVLGLQIEGGNGVKFTFNNINKKSPDDDFSFTICHANDIYSLLKCDLPIDDADEMIDELNQNSDLFKFVRVMRRKFQEAEAEKISSQMMSLPQESTVISVSAPLSSISTVNTGSSSRKKQLDNSEDVHRNFKKVNHGKGADIPFSASSPGSASSLEMCLGHDNAEGYHIT